MTNHRQSLLLSTVGLLMIGASASTALAATEKEANAAEPSVLVFDQKLSSSEVNIDYAMLPKNGYVVVYGTDKDGKPIREPLGHAELKAGDHRGVKVKLGSTPAPGTSLWATLYTDVDQKSGFDKSSDKPLWGDAIPKENKFVIR